MLSLADIRAVLEIIYFLTAIVLAVAAVLGLRQLRIMKLDMRIRNERAAKESALSFSERYLNGIVPLQDLCHAELRAGKVENYDGPIGDFSRASLPNDCLPKAIIRFGKFRWLPALNAMEPIAAAFVLGIADEQVGFCIIGRTYCGTVAGWYDLICLSRAQRACRHWENVVALYQLWSPRINRAELEATRATIDADIEKTATRSITPIGVE